MTTPCSHPHLRCLNEYEIVRKYRCDGCASVMMCKCDEELGRAFLSHQLKAGCEMDTQERVAVTAGFVADVCRECRGLSPEAHPRAEIYGQTSKIKRYYWRELWRRENEIVLEWARARGVPPTDDHVDVEIRQQASEQALHEIKLQHERSPKYIFQEESQDSVIKRCNVVVEELRAVYQTGGTQRKAQVQDGMEWVSVEEYVRRHYIRRGSNVLFLESSPVHALFGVFMWMLIQDPADELSRVVRFGDRHAFEAGRTNEYVSTVLPADFGTPSYGERRAEAIEGHFSREIAPHRDELLWLFDYWVVPSAPLRQYLWAHREEHVKKARALVEILPAATICHILNYLVDAYWGRYLGWPDMLVYKDQSFFLAEIKSSKDKLSEDQKRWIIDNFEILRLPFRLVKIHKSVLSTPSQ